MDKARAQAKYAELVDAGKADLIRKSPAASYVDPSTESDAAFVLWLHNVNRAVGAMCGIGLFDLPDVALRDFYESGMDHTEAAREALVADDLPWPV